MRDGGYEVSRAVFQENLVKQLRDPVFRAGITTLLRPGIDWDIDRAGEIVQRGLVARLPGAAWRSSTT